MQKGGAGAGKKSTVMGRDWRTSCGFVCDGQKTQEQGSVTFGEPTLNADSALESAWVNLV